VLAQKLGEVVAAGGVQILLQGGLNPDLRIEWYEDLFRWIKSTFGLGLHALSPEEILFLARLEDLSVRRVLERLHEAGLDSVPGGGAEILVDHVRRKIAKAKCTSEEWLEVMRVAHQMGLRSSCTMMYGTVDVARDRVNHLVKLRDLQDETRGFTAFFCWDFQYEQGTHITPGETGTHLYLRQQAVARLMLDNVDHVGCSKRTSYRARGRRSARTPKGWRRGFTRPASRRCGGMSGTTGSEFRDDAGARRSRRRGHRRRGCAAARRRGGRRR
jgi:cyclic dehypoxanthinyl futalosine synthase